MGSRVVSCSCKLLFTCDPQASATALNELAKAGIPAQLLDWLDKGVGLVETGLSTATWQAYLRARPPVFIRHICPVQAVWSTGEAHGDTEFFAKRIVSECVSAIARGTFAVQVRVFDHLGTPAPWSRAALESTVSLLMSQQSEAVLDVRAPEQIVSVAYTRDMVYAGVSRAIDNLSAWPGGEHRLARVEGLISRAEFKLLEAIDVFALDLQKGGRALDFGAAPGGWTRVLRLRELQVTAVDPAQLSPMIAADPLVTHEVMTAQAYLRELHGEFDIIVNDMKMDALASAALMISAIHALRRGGLCVMTLKLPLHGQERLVALALEKLGIVYEVLGARQLFHNRSEVTVALRKP